MKAPDATRCARVFRSSTRTHHENKSEDAAHTTAACGLVQYLLSVSIFRLARRCFRSARTHSTSSGSDQLAYLACRFGARAHRYIPSPVAQEGLGPNATISSKRLRRALRAAQAGEIRCESIPPPWSVGLLASWACSSARLKARCSISSAESLTSRNRCKQSVPASFTTFGATPVARSSNAPAASLGRGPPAPAKCPQWLVAHRPVIPPAPYTPTTRHPKGW